MIRAAPAEPEHVSLHLTVADGLVRQEKERTKVHGDGQITCLSGNGLRRTFRTSLFCDGTAFAPRPGCTRYPFLLWMVKDFMLDLVSFRRGGAAKDCSPDRSRSRKSLCQLQRE